MSAGFTRLSSWCELEVEKEEGSNGAGDVSSK
jgi:hypothetical protein